MTYCSVSHSWVAGDLSDDALAPSLSLCAPASESAGSGGDGLWSGIACVWICVCGK